MLSILLLFFILGISIGSFLNVVIDRFVLNQSIAKGRSYADCCKKTLQWYDLVPLFSFLFLKGRCRYCHTKLSLFYPLVEFLTGITFVILYIMVFSFDSTVLLMNSPLLWVKLLFYLCIFSLFIVIFFTDTKYGIIPDYITLCGIFITVMYLLYTIFFVKDPFLLPFPTAHFPTFLSFLYSGIGAFLFFFLIFFFTKGKGMGFGDVKLAFFLGLLLGFPAIITALYIAFISGAIVSIPLVILKKKKISGGTVPFGPFMIFGAIFSLFFNDFFLQTFLAGFSF